jgi:hypothetical protein
VGGLVNIFLSFASEQKDDAELIAMALRERGYAVFFSKDTLPKAETFDLRIEKAVTEADLFIFLISPAAITKGKYTLTELSYARQKWKNPSGRVLPVMVEPTPIDSLPSYLRAVGILEPEGSLPADTAFEADKLLKSRAKSRHNLVYYFMAAGALTGVLSYFAFFNAPVLRLSIFYDPFFAHENSINAKTGPTTTLPGLLFGSLIAICNFVFGLRDKVLIVTIVGITTIGWVLAFDTTMSVMDGLGSYKKTIAATHEDAESSDKSNQAEAIEAASKIEYLPFRGAISGLAGGFVGVLVTVFGILIANSRLRRFNDLLPIVVAGAVLGATVEVVVATLNSSSLGVLLVFVVWQSAVAGLIAHALRSIPTETA